ncbi:MAG: FIST signal transduction protein [Flavobacteriaceae bacterium]
MKILSAKRTNGNWEFEQGNKDLKAPLVLVFGNRKLLEGSKIYEEVHGMFPDGQIVMGSTSGEIYGSVVMEDSIVLTAMEFENGTFDVHSANMGDFDHDTEKLGKALVSKFEMQGLRHIFVVSEGSLVNGSDLIDGLEEKLEQGISVTGGMCGDDARFERTLASYNEEPKEGEVVVIGLYGEHFEVTYASHGGWVPFGPERTVTKSKGNVLYELDGNPALDLYKKYLGERAKDLPEAALLYPLSVMVEGELGTIVRTILSIDEKENTMTLAGDIPEGALVRLMMATVEDIADGAFTAAKQAMNGREKKPDLALLVSCVGRKLVMDQRTEEELEEVVSVIGEDATVTGFYSYGEMAPFEGQNRCRLHNQTMTLTLISE